jgi:hypothetical protein
MHKRRKFLESLRTQLQALSGYGGVWIQRASPNRNMYPAITIYTESESAQAQTIGDPPCLARVANVNISVWIRGTQDDEKLERDFDNYAMDIEKNVILPVGADSFYLTQTDFQFAEDDPEVNVLTLQYRLEYSAWERQPDAA